MRSPFVPICIAAVLLAQCSGSGGITPTPATAVQQSGFQLSPAIVDLTPDAPVDTFNGQGDTAGVTYTANASGQCTTPGGSIVVGGNGTGQLDVAGSPLMFTVAAVGTTPPQTCTVLVTGSDNSQAYVTVNYNNTPVSDIPDMRHRTSVMASRMAAGVTPNALSFTSLVTQIIAISGFSGPVTAKTTCNSAKTGITVSQSDATDFTVIPWGQGAISNACTVAFADASNDAATVSVAMSIGAMAKLTASPSTALQFGCAGSSAPLNCQTHSQVAIAESGTQTYKIVTRPTLKGNCANAFYGPMTMTADGTTFAQSLTGSAVTVDFAGLLAGTSLNCSKIVIADSNAPEQRVTIGVDSSLGAAPSGVTAASAPSCTGPDPHVADPNAPHGMYVWNPYKVNDSVIGSPEAYMKQYVIGKDPNLCGVSLVIGWSEIEPTRGNYTWDTITSEAQDYVNAGLTVNLLIAGASEVGKNDSATPKWVTGTNAGDDAVPTVICDGQVPYPMYWNSTYESDYETFISTVISHYANDPTIGYMRFGIGAGVEAYPAHFSDYPNDACSQAFIADGYSFNVWVNHARRIVNALAADKTQSGTTKQLMVALNYIGGWSNTLYDFPNMVAQDAAKNGIAFGTENLGIGHVADYGKAPASCNPQATNASIYWCEAFVRHAGEVPFEFQPIEAVVDPLTNADGTQLYNISFPNLLQYALINNTQLFELYPQDWIEANAPTQFWPVASGTPSPKIWKDAMNATALIVGAHHQ